MILESNLQLIQSQQSHLSDALDQLEQELSRMENTEKSRVDIERQNSYKLAEQINQDLETIGKGLKTIRSQINTSYEEQIDKNDPFNQIVDILNSHLNALQYCDRLSKQLEMKLLEAERAVAQQIRDHERFKSRS